MKLSRKDTATIISSEWVPDTKDPGILWHVVKTDRTGERSFRSWGAYRADLEMAQRQEVHRRLAVGNTVAIGELHTIPVVPEQLTASIKPGLFFHIGAMNDGLWDVCGKLVFSRIAHYGGADTIPADGQAPELCTALAEATRIYVADGRAASERYLDARGYQLFDGTGLVTGPCLLDPCVRELDHAVSLAP